ncbi:MAG: divTM7 [Candidatus Saccharibacteria bacterium]|nr:divTM7 [Candidatus Saccharibacteria bacterium]
MDDEPTVLTQGEQLSFWIEHRFLLLIIGTLVVATILVSISIVIYNVSGSAQLDLSRPGYQSVSNKVDRTDPVTDYSAFGPVNKGTVNDFTTIYDQQADKAKGVDAFNGDPLNPEVLEFGDPTTFAQ